MLPHMGVPTTKKLIEIARTGVPDGLHIDDAGRICTGEYKASL